MDGTPTGDGPDDLVLIHGAWVTPESWSTFRQPFDEAGYKVHAPAWPQIFDGAVAIGRLTLGKIVDHLESEIRKLKGRPVLVGHSFGGLVTQLLLDRGVGRIGVALNPAPIAGVVPGTDAFSAIAPIVARVGGWKRPYAFSREIFGRRFANAAPSSLVDDAFARYVIPAPGAIFHQAALRLGTRIDPRRRDQPLLVTGSTADRLISARMSRATARLQRRSRAQTDYVEFDSQSHFLIAEPGWERVAGTVLGWIETIPRNV